MTQLCRSLDLPYAAKPSHRDGLHYFSCKPCQMLMLSLSMRHIFVKLGTELRRPLSDQRLSLVLPPSLSADAL
jgi:hypothetical protein